MLAKTLRRFLTRKGLLVVRVASTMPPTCADYFRALAKQAARPGRLVCFDNDEEIQSEILEAFPAAAVSFGSPFSRCPAILTDPFAGQSVKAAQLAIVIDGENFNVHRLAEAAPWIFRANSLLVRSSLGHFWSGEGDVCDLARFLAKHGFTLHDAIDYVRAGLLRAPNGRVALVFRRVPALTGSVPEFRHRQARLREAVAYLSAPIARLKQLETIAGRGSFGFYGGVCNPGGIQHNDGLVLLARGESAPWALSRHDAGSFAAGCKPLLVELDSQLRVKSGTPLSWTGPQGSPRHRLEDFRLLRFQGQLLSNHSILTLPERAVSHGLPVRLHEVQTRVGLSRIDIARGTITLLGSPNLPLPLGQTEKNWAMIATGNDLHLLYSFNPYRLFRLTRWNGLRFEPALTADVDVPSTEPGVALRNSINPVDYDEEHYLHVVHQFYRGNNYVFWAILLSKRTLLPVMMSGRPLARNWHSASSSVLYLCSAVPTDTDVLFFAGLNDSSTACWRIPRRALETEWQPITAALRERTLPSP